MIDAAQHSLPRLPLLVVSGASGAGKSGSL